MKAMLLEKTHKLPEEREPLVLRDIPKPEIKEDEILIQVLTCGVCHTELDEIEGRTSPPDLPVVPGHQVVGRVVDQGPGASKHKNGDRVGIGWIYSACGKCQHCLDGDDNLCESFLATGRDMNGGYAEYMAVPENFAYPIPDLFSDSEAAPLLCAGAIGYRSLRLANIDDGHKLGLTGFGASGHLVLKLARFMYPGSEVFVFARSPEERDFAMELGAVWAGDTFENSPVKLNAIIDTTPVWAPVVEALKNLDSGGRLVINAIRKEDNDKEYLLTLDYPTHLWMEKEIKSVANVASRDIAEFLELAAEMELKPEYQEYKLEEANRALLEMKNRKIRGAKVLRIG